MKMIARAFLFSTALSGLLPLTAGAASAQAAGQAGSQTGATAEAESAPLRTNPSDGSISEAQSGAEIGDDIVVTAQKRTERLTNVPLAVTAIGGEALATRQINDTTALTQAIPSLTFQQGANPTNTNFRIRGVGTQLFSQGVESSVSIVTDGVVAARQAQGFSDLADIERVEVLRGPQGTLFGRNASAGVINIVTARPSSTFGGRADFTIAEKNEYRARGTVTGPVADSMNARLSGYYNHVGGYVRNVVTGRDVQGSESYGVRGKLDWDATSRLNLLLIGDFRKSDSLCCASTWVKVTNPVLRQTLAPVRIAPDSREVVENIETFANSQSYTASLQADYDLGGATITSITAYQDYDLYVNQPVDRSDSSTIRYLGAGVPYVKWDLNAGELFVKNFTQELRIASAGSGDLTYTAGLFYSDLQVVRPFRRRRATCVAGVLFQTCAPANVRYQSSSNTATLNTYSYAAFGQAEYRIVGGLKALGGLRVQYERGRNVGTQLGTLEPGDALFPGVPANLSGSTRADDFAVTGKAGLQYEFTRDLQTYASYTRGYKGLGYNMEAATDFTNQTVLDPEYVNAYEVGFKMATADRKFTLNIAGFWSEYDNLQVQANRSDSATGVVRFVTTNAGSSTAKGFEIESTIRPSSNFSVAVGLTYVESTVSIDGLNCPLQFQASAPAASTPYPVNSCYRPITVVNGANVIGAPTQNLRDQQLPATPKVRINVAPRFEHEIPGLGMDGFIQTVVNFQSKQSFSLEQDPASIQPSYTLVDINLGLQTADGRYTLSVFAKNLFDVNYYTSLGPSTLLTNATSPNNLAATFNKDADRYFGASLGVRF